MDTCHYSICITNILNQDQVAWQLAIGVQELVRIQHNLLHEKCVSEKRRDLKFQEWFYPTFISYQKKFQICSVNRTYSLLLFLENFEITTIKMSTRSEIPKLILKTGHRRNFFSIANHQNKASRYTMYRSISISITVIKYNHVTLTYIYSILHYPKKKKIIWSIITKFKLNNKN